MPDDHIINLNAYIGFYLNVWTLYDPIYYMNWTEKDYSIKISQTISHKYSQNKDPINFVLLTRRWEIGFFHTHKIRKLIYSRWMINSKISLEYRSTHIVYILLCICWDWHANANIASLNLSPTINYICRK